MDQLQSYLREIRTTRPQMEDFLKELVRTPSLSGEEDKIAGLVSDKLNELGYAFEVDGMGNLIAHRGNGKGRTILFDGHLDHVQPGDPEGWAYGPYKAEVIDGVLYGRATVDMKGALAAMIYGCAAPEVEGSVVIAFVVHEETNEGVATKRIIEKKGLKINACILGEPTDLRLSIGQRGRCVFKIITRGSTSHASMPELGVNALYKMAPIIIEIEKVNETLPTHMFLGKGSMSVTTISCQPGVGPIIPDKCEIQVDRRIIPQETLMEVLQEMKRVSPGAEVELLVDELRCYTGFSTEAEQYFPGWITDREHWVVKESLIALKEGISRIPEIVGWKFSTDGVATAGKLGIPTVGFGPGDPSLAHQPNEHIFLDDVFEASKGYCALAYKLST